MSRVSVCPPNRVNSKSFELDAAEFVTRADADLAYLDPPYNQHKYLGNYHIWETLVRWDKPEVYGVARKRIDCKTRQSAFNSRVRCEVALSELVTRARARVLIVSFNDEGYISPSAIVAMLSARGAVSVLALPYKRYVGAQIGIHNPRGERVGEIGHLKNSEYLFIAGEKALLTKAGLALIPKPPRRSREEPHANALPMA